MNMRLFRTVLSCGVLAISSAAIGQLAVVSSVPGLNAINVPRTGEVTVTFDRAVNPGTFVPANFRMFGKVTGPVAGVVTFSNGDRTVTFTPGVLLQAGEVMELTMARHLRGADNVALRSSGYVIQFTTVATRSSRIFSQIASISNRDATGAQTRIYGGVACDLNRDGYADITTVNEVSSDLRVFLNRADHSGLYQAMLFPYTTIPIESSPNEVADFDADGFIDIVVGSYYSNEIAVCFGNGDGTFDTPQVMLGFARARGFGLVDGDGDGDTDITVACSNSDNIAYVRNDGNRSFAAPTYFEGGVGDEYGLTAADMNNDGLLDLVTAGESSRTVCVVRANGNGTFTPQAARQVGGFNWVVMCGDLNGDGRMDVSAANSGSSTGGILMGNGNGTLGAVTVFPVGGSATSTDLADLDGDGDIDWILSSFGGGNWYVFENDGAGVFTPDLTYPAPANPSCAVPTDFDNDGDIDLVLTDEIADVMLLLRNGCLADTDFDGDADSDDVTAFFGAWEGGMDLGDVDEDGDTDSDDVVIFFTTWDGGC